MRAITVGVAVLLATVSCANAVTSGSDGASWRATNCLSAAGSPADASDEPGFSRGSWNTDFSRHCVPLSEITSGGPSRDGIPPLDRPETYAQGRADAWLQPQEPVIAVVEGTEARAYPLKILIWHEIANDTIAGRPIAVTFCPLCNTALVFERRVGGRTLSFGTTGNLRYSDLVMWDRETESWWQQATGEAIVGELTGARLARLDALVLSYEEFKKAHPNGLVLSKEAANEEAKTKTGAGRQYGVNPYAGYDRADTPPISAFWGARRLDARLLPKARVAIATFAAPPVAYTVDDLPDATAVNDDVGGRPIALLALRGVSSVLDTRSTSDGSDVGQAAMFDRRVGALTLTFRGSRAKTFTDEQTGSTWLVSGVAIAGPLAGTRLASVPHEVTYWFIWSVFRPDTVVRRP